MYVFSMEFGLITVFCGMLESDRAVLVGVRCRVEEHPPGEKAMHDFEDIVNYRIDGRKRRNNSIPGQIATVDEKTEPIGLGGDEKKERLVGQVEQGVLLGEPGAESTAVERRDDDKENVIPMDEQMGSGMVDSVEAERVTAAATGGKLDGGKQGAAAAAAAAADQKVDALSSALAAVEAANDRVAQIVTGSDKMEDAISKEKVAGSPAACQSKGAGGLGEVQTPGVCWSGKEDGKKARRLHDAWCVLIVIILRRCWSICIFHHVHA